MTMIALLNAIQIRLNSIRYEIACIPATAPKSINRTAESAGSLPPSKADLVVSHGVLLRGGMCLSALYMGDDLGFVRHGSVLLRSEAVGNALVPMKDELGQITKLGCIF